MIRTLAAAGLAAALIAAPAVALGAGSAQVGPRSKA